MLNTWDAEFSTGETNSFAETLAFIHLSRIRDTGLSTVLRSLLEQQDYQGLCGLSISYDTVTPSDAYSAAQIIALWKKRADVDFGIDKEAVAFGKFISSERSCQEINDIFRLWGAGKFQFTRDVDSVLYAAARKISLVLGEVPAISELMLTFGPGATTQVTKRNASARRKLSQVHACSEDLVPLLAELLEEMPAWLPGDPGETTALVSVELHPGNLSFVPKNALTDRSVVVEPMLNGMLQLGIGRHLQTRLKRWGVDITDQTRNQQLARLGSVTGGLSTLDLSSASDCIARELVAHLLPVDWFILLDRARTGSVVYKGESMKLQKFSSMGNGFTFPLETLIFWALASSAVELTSQDQTCAVYGDDIIVPTPATDLVSRVLHAVGFTLNTSKSYVTGPFRESCGKDYHSGIDIRPVFLKDRLSGESAFILHNFFVRANDPESASAVLSILDPTMILWGPDGYGDGHLISDPPVELQPTSSKNIQRGFCGFEFETYVWCSRKSFSDLPGDYVYPAYLASTRPISSITESVVVDRVLAALCKKAEYLRPHWADFESLVRDETPPVVPVKRDKNSKEIVAWGVTNPGTHGFKRISIYTLKP